MYERYYGLQERPFDLSPDPRFLFLSNRHREALANLRHGLSGRPGLTVLIGEAGTGKTTLIRTAIQALNGSSGGIVHVTNPTLTRSEFFEYLAAGFGFSAEAAVSKPRFLRALEAAVAAHATANTVLALVVDEAQSLPHTLLEEIRLLTNLETASGHSLAVALVGQPELAERLNDSTLRQLKQRIALRCELTPFELLETASFIAARVGVAGGRAANLFTREAVIAIHEYSKGIPRTISVICDNALVSGFALDVKPVGRDVVLEVCRDFHLGNPPVQARPKSGVRPPDPEGGSTPGSQAENVTAQTSSQVGGFTRPPRFLFF